MDISTRFTVVRADRYFGIPVAISTWVSGCTLTEFCMPRLSEEVSNLVVIFLMGYYFIKKELTVGWVILGRQRPSCDRRFTTR